MMLKIWLMTLRDDGQNAFFMKPMVTNTDLHWTAEAYVLYMMEWYYLLEQYHDQQKISQEDYQEAVKHFQAIRLRRGNKLKSEVAPELYQTYMMV